MDVVYFEVDFGEDRFDGAISFQTMHHFSHEEKIKLYKRVHNALKTSGLYIEADNMVTEQSEEDFFYSENHRIRKQLNIPDGA